MLRLITRCHPMRLVSQSSCPLTIKLKQLEQGQLNWRLQETGSMEEKQFSMGESETFRDLEEHLTTHLQDIREVTFLDFDRTTIAATNQLQQIGYGFQVQITTQDGNQERLSLENESEAKKDTYSQLAQFCEDVELPLLQKNVIMGYLKKVDLVLQNKHGLKVFDDLTYPEVSISKDSLSLSLLEGMITRSGINKTSENLLYRQYLAVQHQVTQQESVQRDLERRAHRNTKAKLSLGLVALIGQFYFVGYGTYVAYSWDIMEPIAYFINLSFTILFSYQYFRLKDEFSPSTFYEYLKNKELLRLA